MKPRFPLFMYLTVNVVSQLAFYYMITKSKMRWAQKVDEHTWANKVVQDEQRKLSFAESYNKANIFLGLIEYELNNLFLALFILNREKMTSKSPHCQFDPDSFCRKMFILCQSNSVQNLSSLTLKTKELWGGGGGWKTPPLRCYTSQNSSVLIGLKDLNHTSLYFYNQNKRKYTTLIIYPWKHFIFLYNVSHFDR